MQEAVHHRHVIESAGGRVRKVHGAAKHFGGSFAFTYAGLLARRMLKRVGGSIVRGGPGEYTVTGSSRGSVPPWSFRVHACAAETCTPVRAEMY